MAARSWSHLAAAGVIGVGAAAIFVRALRSTDTAATLRSVVAQDPGAFLAVVPGLIALAVYSLVAGSAWWVVRQARERRAGRWEWLVLLVLFGLVAVAWWPERYARIFHPAPDANLMVIYGEDGRQRRLSAADAGTLGLDPTMDESRDINATTIISQHGLGAYLQPDSAPLSVLQQVALAPARYLHPPGSFLILSVAGENARSQRLFCLLTFGLALAALVVLGRRLLGGGAGALAALAFASGPGVVHSFAFKVNTDVLPAAIGCIAGAILLWPRHRISFRRAAVVAAVLVALVLTKYTAAILVAAVALALSITGRTPRWLSLGIPAALGLLIYHLVIASHGVVLEATHLGRILLSPFAADVALPTPGSGGFGESMKQLFLYSLGPLASVMWLLGTGEAAASVARAGDWGSRCGADDRAGPPLALLVIVTVVFVACVFIVNASMRYVAPGMWAPAILIAWWVMRASAGAARTALFSAAVAYSITKLLVLGWID